MKLIPVVETRDVDAHLYSYTIGRKRNRPIETEADLIAAAEPPGEVHLRCMVQEIDDRCDALDVCDTCDMPPDHVAGYFAFMHDEWARNLAGAGVEWDPELRL